jgi:predicted GNAT family acetyltransferase
MSLYAQYIEEREGFSIIESDHGFATYIKVDDETYYLRDIFVEKEFRKSGLAKELSRQVAEIAKADGAKRLTGSVSTIANGVTVSMKAILADGFEFSHANGNMLYFAKEL